MGCGRRPPTTLALLAAVVVLQAQTPGRQAAAQQYSGNYLVNHPGFSDGIPYCSGNAGDANCFRIDSPVPPDVCTMRDATTQACLATSPNYAYPSTVLGSRPESAHVVLHEDGWTTCNAQDPMCVPGGIHTQQDIDWSQVEGAEYMVVARKELEGSANIFVDAAHGDDRSGWGTRESPLRSLRAALKRWLVPGKCHPYCGDVAHARSGTVHMRQGIYAGADNREIELLIDAGAAVTVTVDSDTSDGVRGVSMSRDPSVDVRIEGGAFWIKATGAGTLSLLSMSVRNTSSDAIIVGASTTLVTDLHFPHGRYNQVLRTLDATGAVVYSPNWDISVDERFVGQDVKCDSSNGCTAIRPTHGFDARFHTPFDLGGATSACQGQRCAVPAPSPAPGLAQYSQWQRGLGAVVTSAGTGCINGGVLVAINEPGVSGSGFSALFTVHGHISSVSVTAAGTGYTNNGQASATCTGVTGCVGSGFAGTCQTTGGMVTGITVSNVGFDYSADALPEITCADGTEGRFTPTLASYGAVAGLTIKDPGSGYTTVDGVSLRIESGGHGCTNVSFQPYLVYSGDLFAGEP